MVFKFAVVGLAIAVPPFPGSPSYHVTVPVSPSNTVLSFTVKSVLVSLGQIVNGVSIGVGNSFTVKLTDCDTCSHELLG